MDIITNQQARQFILAKQGLIGAYRFKGKDGAYTYVRQAGCIQYDPVDVCGKNAELTLWSRVKEFKKSMLFDLLYKDRVPIYLNHKTGCRTIGVELMGAYLSTIDEVMFLDEIDCTDLFEEKDTRNRIMIYEWQRQPEVFHK